MTMRLLSVVNNNNNMLLHLLMLLVVLLLQVDKTEGAVPCESDPYCELVLRTGSSCLDGFCSNPFHSGGCLQHFQHLAKDRANDQAYVRVCGSEDPPEAFLKGHCEKPTFSYPEVRLSVANWESSFMAAWILQILLSEVLQVPVSIEVGQANLNADFYNQQNKWDWPTSSTTTSTSTTSSTNSSDSVGANNFQALKTAHQLGGVCTNMDTTIDTIESANNRNRGCANVIPEVWKNDEVPLLRKLQDQGIILRPTSLGVSGQEDIVIPDRTAQYDPSLTSFHGLQGKHNQGKLANIFQFPTTWRDYCMQVSPNNCDNNNSTHDNTVAARPPLNPQEGDLYFAPGLYTGYFRPHPNCDTTTTSSSTFTNDSSCTGVFLDYPCDWSYNTVQKLVWLDIPLQPIQYSYSELLQINLAANATKAHTIGVWFKPDPLNELWVGTDSQLTPVNLPPATSTCLQHKINNDITARCLDKMDNIAEQAGDPRGACQDPPNPLLKVMAVSLRDAGENPDMDEALWSPAHLFIERFEIDNIQYSQIFENWLQRGTDKWNFDLRDATCEFVAENLGWIQQSYMPKTFPRVIENVNIQGTVDQIAAMVMSIFALLLVTSAAIAANRRRTTKIMYHTQLGILYAVLGGLFLVAVGAFLLTFPPTDALCPTPYWFSNLGYAMELTPVIVKVDAISHAVRRGNAMHRVRLSTRTIRLAVLVGMGFLGAVTLSWTLVHPSKQSTAFELTSNQNEHGATIVSAAAFCESANPFWAMATFLFFSVFCLYGLFLAFLARTREDRNGARNYATLLASHVVIVGFRAAIFLLSESINEAYVRLYTSIMLSLDCIAAVSIFTGPKLFEKREEQEDSEEPLPDLFLETTVVKCDIVGFSKWASMREPTHVFQLLEAIFAEFDQICERRRILKIETVGDSYTAVAGIPNSQKDHAVRASRFALDCMARMHRLVSELEITFGPDTSELNLRIGMNSGAVTGGFMRGKGARFQLFGDVVNRTGKMESMGEAGKIHLSEACAEALRKEGKGSWVEKREDSVFAKGVGALSTYWLVYGMNRVETEEQSETFDADHHIWAKRKSSASEQRKRLVRWNAQVLLAVLREIVACRVAPGPIGRISNSSVNNRPSTDAMDYSISSNPQMPLEEVKEIIMLPQFDRRIAIHRGDAEAVEIPQVVKEQLMELVAGIADLYQDNPFHNFQHASHVVMAATKYLSRINAAADLETSPTTRQSFKAEKLHDHTYGITSDPMTHFAILFSALIHDVDHPGVPNGRMAEENKVLGSKYRNRSVAEQNSFDLAWKLFSKSRFNDLRKMICSDHKELERFRSLIINSVMATDLGDKELKALRNNRWQKAFSAKSDETESDTTSSETYSESNHAAINRKATIVIEHVIQAADVSHTMQHWHVYRQWNFNLFREMHRAYKDGRSDTNPVDFWYEGEIGFFDFYIIPLSEKLRDCGVFGVSSDENLSYATANRAEWVAKGKDVVAEMVKQIEEEEAFGDESAEEQHPDIVEP
ncbi:Receptor-type guanylate cyclase gcy [Seminavis robusta]|uniref:Receptor-type guanylate cyclase gcy n=1 Tax=Seminavis robusta TaxID=568900 RepID=A0A9N8DMI1_9STRA|nr:Receptor-type guanylate cyclase gcy [Seminavis robusta]|eukprot:Sro226_g092010.1 Receptor-type guanylate cyclase gcy (1505) ;mRNA; r:24296-30189